MAKGTRLWGARPAKVSGDRPGCRRGEGGTRLGAAQPSPGQARPGRCPAGTERSRRRAPAGQSTEGPGLPWGCPGAASTAPLPYGQGRAGQDGAAAPLAPGTGSQGTDSSRAKACAPLGRSQRAPEIENLRCWEREGAGSVTFEH